MIAALIVSTHAPARGATSSFSFFSSCFFSFNSRTREGCDSVRAILLLRPSGFNSRTREGCDAPWSSVVVLRARFNSRTREGCDRRAPVRTRTVACFNSRTREGCDLLRGRPWSSVVCFNSRTREGCDNASVPSCPVLAVSTHAPARGATGNVIHTLICVMAFQLTHPRGVRLFLTVNLVICRTFQLTHPRGVRLHATTLMRLQ